MIRKKRSIQKWSEVCREN